MLIQIVCSVWSPNEIMDITYHQKFGGTMLYSLTLNKLDKRKGNCTIKLAVSPCWAQVRGVLFWTSWWVFCEHFGAKSQIPQNCMWYHVWIIHNVIIFRDHFGVMKEIIYDYLYFITPKVVVSFSSKSVCTKIMSVVFND